MHDLLIGLVFVSMVTSPVIVCALSQQPGSEKEEGELTDRVDPS